MWVKSAIARPATIACCPQPAHQRTATELAPVLSAFAELAFARPAATWRLAITRYVGRGIVVTVDAQPAREDEAVGWHLEYRDGVNRSETDSSVGIDALVDELLVRKRLRWNVREPPAVTEVTMRITTDR